MEVLTTIAEARSRRRQELLEGQRVALVPTMGFLHQGHLALVRRARELAESVWVSVFVNPTQFGPGEDFAAYPRDLDRDCRLLAAEAVDVVFAPTPEEMYPREPVVQIGFGGLEGLLCGGQRPGHFGGVGIVVSKLLNIVQPEVAVFGQKDAQQAVLIRRLVSDLDVPTCVEVVATVREADGLAMSSRNAYLDPEQRRAATALYRALTRGREAIESGQRDPARVEALMAEVIEAEPLLSLEYSACVSPQDLAPPSVIEAPILLAIAARAGQARLIDNIYLREIAAGEGPADGV